MEQPPERNWICRFHPVHWFHEVGCPHMQWTPEQLADAEDVRENGARLAADARRLTVDSLASAYTKGMDALDGSRRAIDSTDLEPERPAKP